ncbi:MAG TPA: DUF222 domain-containing protein [Actinomycetota bacterium]
METALLHRAAPDPVAMLDECHRRAVDACAERLAWIAAIEERRLWRRDGATSMTAWLAGRWGLARSTTREMVRVASALRSLPAIREAYEERRISWDQIRPLTRFATPETDEAWSRRAPRMRPVSLWQEVRRHESLEREEEDSLHRRRYLRLDWDPERPLLHLEGMLASEQGAALQAALGSRAERMETPRDALDPVGAKLADALVGSVTAAPADKAASPVLVVHTAAELLARVPEPGRPHLAETESGVRLSAEAVRRLACHAKVEWVLETDGRPVGIGRRMRAIPPRLWRLLRFRDRACRFPGCERGAWLKAHHIHHWARGGPTDLDNLVLLCHAHHRLLHEGGWRLRGHPSSELAWLRPDGTRLVTSPEVLSS